MYFIRPRNLLAASALILFAAVWVFGNDEDDGAGASLAEVPAAADRAAPLDARVDAASADRSSSDPEAWLETEGFADEPVASAWQSKGKAKPSEPRQLAAQAGAGPAGQESRTAYQPPQPGSDVRRQSAPLDEDFQRDSVAALAEDIRGAIDP